MIYRLQITGFLDQEAACLLPLPYLHLTLIMKSTFLSLSSHERTRVEDYLNDKIQVAPDFESLNSLLSSLRAQQELQQKQVAPYSVAPTFGFQQY